MTKFLSDIEVKVDGDIVRARLFDGPRFEDVATCRKVAIRAAMSILEQLDPDHAVGAEIIPLMQRVVGG